MSYHNINLWFSFHPPPLIAAFIISQVSSLLFSQASSLVKFFFSSNNFPPSALYWYSTTLFCFQPSALSVRFPGVPCILRHDLYHQSKGSTSWISQAWLGILCLPIWQPPTSPISGELKRIYWDHLSTEGMACEVLIDHLVVCALSHTGLKSHKQPSKLRDTKLHRSSLQQALFFSLN